MSQISDIRDAIVALNTAVKSQYDDARGALLARHENEATALQKRQGDEAAALDDGYQAKIAYLANLAAVEPAGAALED